MKIKCIRVVVLGCLVTVAAGALTPVMAQRGAADKCIVEQSGERTKEELDCVFHQKMPNYLRQLGSTNQDLRQLNGNIVIGATVMPSGQISRSWVVNSDINDPLAESLIADSLMKIEFGEKGSHNVDIEYSMRFVNGVPHVSR